MRRKTKKMLEGQAAQISEMLSTLHDSCVALKDALNTICNNDRKAVRAFADHQVALIDRRYEAIVMDIDAKLAFIKQMMKTHDAVAVDEARSRMTTNDALEA